MELPLASGEHHYAVTAVYRHPEADVAAIRVEGVSEREITWVWLEPWSCEALGLPVRAHGYPLSIDWHGDTPTPRLFEGYVQRCPLHQSGLGFRYRAVELSFRAPRGLSGAAVFHSNHIGRLYAIIAENVQTETEIVSRTEVHENGSTYRENVRDVITYGIAVCLNPLSLWLDEIAAPVSDEERTRRSENQHRWRSA